MTTQTVILSLATRIYNRTISISFVYVVIGSLFLYDLAEAGRPVEFVNQGPSWAVPERNSFYSSDMGSRLVPYDWIRSLRSADGEYFMRNQLSRYGFVRMPTSGSNPEGLPAGFLVVGAGAEKQLGIGCASCHSSEIQVQHRRYVIDGAPGYMDFENFLRDLDSAVAYTLQTPSEFRRFSTAVLGAIANEESVNGLKVSLQDWYGPFHELISGSLSRPNIWGGGRLDALTLIQNKVSGLMIGDVSKNFVISENIHAADAPSKPFFLWNTNKQDFTGWTGQLPNGTDELAMIHNVGVALGSFTNVYPLSDPSNSKQFDYLVSNSINFDGIAQMINLIKRMGPPKWPWKVNSGLVSDGKIVYDRECASCHGIKRGQYRPSETDIWETHVENVGTDVREWSVYTNKVNTGILSGYPVGLSAVLGDSDYADSLVGAVALGIMFQKFPSAQLFAAPQSNNAVGSYVGRVLEGIWATPPYLHNASVPTLDELLKPASQRVKSFEVGRIYDTKRLGLARNQRSGKQRIRTLTGCDELDSGNSNCGHEFGTKLSDESKRALLEYLKTL